MTYDPNSPPDPTNFWDPRNDWNDVKARTSGGLPMPGGPGIVLLAILYFILLLSTAAAIAAVVAGPVLRIYGKLVDWRDPPGWGFAYTAAFVGFFAYYLVAVFQTQAGGREMYHIAAPLLSVDGLTTRLATHTLPLLACAGGMWWRLKSAYYAYSGVLGYARAFVAAVLCLWLSTAMIAATARRVVDGAGESAQGMGEGMLGLAFVAAVFAVIGGVIAVWPVLIGERMARPIGVVRTPSVLRSYVTAVLVLLTYLIGSLALEFAFNTLDAVWIYYRDAEARAAVTIAEWQYVTPYVLGFISLQVAVVGFAGGVIQWREARLFPGRAGWLRASSVAFVAIAVAVGPFAGLIAWMAGQERFKELFQYF